MERMRSTADVRRVEVLDASVRTFARTGYHATPVTDVAAAAGISQGYVLRLFGTKLALFVATLDHAHARILAALEQGARRAADGAPPEQVLRAMADAYAELIRDRDLIMLQVHAQSAADVPEIKETTRRGLERFVTVSQTLSGADDDQVQQFLAFGQLCHLVVTAELGDVEAHWAAVVAHGITH